MLATIQPRPRHDITAQYVPLLCIDALPNQAPEGAAAPWEAPWVGRRLRYCGPREAPRHVAPIRRRVGGPFGSGDR